MSEPKTTEEECRALMAKIEDGIRGAICNECSMAKDALELHRLRRELRALHEESIGCDDINAAEFLRDGIAAMLGDQ